MDSLISSDNNISKFFLDNVSKYCDKCGTEYNVDDISIVSESISLVIIQAQCHNCKALYMAQINKPLQMAKKIPLRLDIPAADIKKYFDKGQISTDELLETRKKLLKAINLPVLLSVISKQTAKTAKTKKKV